MLQTQELAELAQYSQNAAEDTPKAQQIIAQLAGNADLGNIMDKASKILLSELLDIDDNEEDENENVREEVGKYLDTIACISRVWNCMQEMVIIDNSSRMERFLEPVEVCENLVKQLNEMEAGTISIVTPSLIALKSPVGKLLATHQQALHSILITLLPAITKLRALHRARRAQTYLTQHYENIMTIAQTRKESGDSHISEVEWEEAAEIVTQRDKAASTLFSLHEVERKGEYRKEKTTEDILLESTISTCMKQYQLWLQSASESHPVFRIMEELFSSLEPTHAQLMTSLTRQFSNTETTQHVGEDVYDVYERLLTASEEEYQLPDFEMDDPRMSSFGIKLSVMEEILNHIEHSENGERSNNAPVNHFITNYLNLYIYPALRTLSSDLLAINFEPMDVAPDHLISQCVDLLRIYIESHSTTRANDAERANLSAHSAKIENELAAKKHLLEKMDWIMATNNSASGRETLLEGMR
jgi:hypothetical protein